MESLFDSEFNGKTIKEPPIEPERKLLDITEEIGDITAQWENQIHAHELLTNYLWIISISNASPIPR